MSNPITLRRSLNAAGPWTADASCSGAEPDGWFPERGASPTPAKTVCAGCPVRLDCLNYSLVAEEQFGIWGGLTVRERKRILVRRKLRAT